MPLTEAQVDRYSRQIIVPRVGGRGQERLLAARILLAGDARDIEAPLAYLVGAGVGTICVKSSAGQVAFGETNRDASLIVTDDTARVFDLGLTIVGSEAARKIADEITRNRDVRALVIARLDAPGKIAVFPDLRDSRTIDAGFGACSEAAGFIAMLATAEAFKLIARYEEHPSSATIEFDGYETRVRVDP